MSFFPINDTSFTKAYVYSSVLLVYFKKEYKNEYCESTFYVCIRDILKVILGLYRKV